MGLFDMAMRLAEQRAARINLALLGFWSLHKVPPCDRGLVNPAIHPVSAEYYRIIDRITRGEKP